MIENSPKNIENKCANLGEKLKGYGQENLLNLYDHDDEDKSEDYVPPNTDVDEVFDNISKSNNVDNEVDTFVTGGHETSDYDYDFLRPRSRAESLFNIERNQLSPVDYIDYFEDTDNHIKFDFHSDTKSNYLWIGPFKFNEANLLKKSIKLEGRRQPEIRERKDPSTKTPSLWIKLFFRQSNERKTDYHTYEVSKILLSNLFDNFTYYRLTNIEFEGLIQSESLHDSLKQHYQNLCKKFRDVSQKGNTEDSDSDMEYGDDTMNEINSFY